MAADRIGKVYLIEKESGEGVWGGGRGQSEPAALRQEKAHLLL